MTPGSLAGGLYTTGLSNVGSVPNGYQWLTVGQGAKLTITDGVIEGNHTGSPRNEAGVLHLPSDGKLTLDGVILRNWNEPALYDFGGIVVLRNGTTFDTVGRSGQHDELRVHSIGGTRRPDDGSGDALQRAG